MSNTKTESWRKELDFNNGKTIYDFIDLLTFFRNVFTCVQIYDDKGMVTRHDEKGKGRIDYILNMHVGPFRKDLFDDFDEVFKVLVALNVINPFQKVESTVYITDEGDNYPPSMRHEIIITVKGEVKRD